MAITNQFGSVDNPIQQLPLLPTRAYPPRRMHRLPCTGPTDVLQRWKGIPARLMLLNHVLWDLMEAKKSEYSLIAFVLGCSRLVALFTDASLPSDDLLLDLTLALELHYP